MKNDNRKINPCQSENSQSSDFLGMVKQKFSNDRHRHVVRALDKTVNYLFGLGAPVYPSTAQGRPLRKITPELAIRDLEKLHAWWSCGVRRFIFRPCDAGQVWVDLDAKNGKDGPREYSRITGVNPREGVHTQTPSNGCHVPHQADGRDFISAEVAPGVEIKSKAFITIPGSQSDKGFYIFHGSFKDIEPLPASLRDIMPVRNPNPAPIPMRTGRSLGLDKITDTLYKQGTYPVPHGYHEFTFQFAKYARKQGHGPDEIISYILPMLAGTGHPKNEIIKTVRSLF